MSQATYQRRQARVAEALQRLGWQGLVVAPGENFRYLAGYSPTADERPCYFFLTPAGSAFVVPSLNAAQAAAHVDAPTFTYEDADGPAAALDQALAKLPDLKRSRAVLAVDDPMRSDFLLILNEALPEVTFQLGSKVIAPLRMVKDEEERQRLRESAKLADRAVLAAVAALREGVTEREISQIASANFQANGAERVNFVTVAFGDNGAYPHHHTSDRVLKAGEPILMDFGATFKDYGSDITRVAYLGEPSARYREVYAVVERAVQAALAAVKPGVKAGDVDAAARRVISEAGYGEAFVHRTGHGIGLSGHEQPWIRADEDTVLEEGMAFSIEPGIYLPGDVGIRLEEIVIVGPNGPEIVSDLSRDILKAGA